ncbi:MAG TPA: nuclear transport factor 2 family protein [Bryobacteraceae bacterium]|jgi:predicted SnoaL-like aldol condensation-catalyzing enzyme|nr:nuclear transport factor 2 family protein [Bryobacteraceae bacterium]
MKRIAFVGLLSVIAAVVAFGQAAPVVAADDPAALFRDKDPVLNRNKQAAMHIVIDLLEAGHWNEANKWITDRYIQHNPNFGSGLAPVVKAFGARGPGRPIPASPKDWRTKVVAVVAEGDLVAVITRVELPDPRNAGQTYTTTHYDVWRFVDGKADEHWDEGRINPPRPPQ